MSPNEPKIFSLHEQIRGENVLIILPQISKSKDSKRRMVGFSGERKNQVYRAEVIQKGYLTDPEQGYSDLLA